MATESVSINGRFGPLNDLVRRKLRVSDAKSAAEIKEALLNLYPTEQTRIQQEASGMPVLSEKFFTTGSPVFISPTEDEMTQAKSNLDEDMKIVVREPALRNISANIEGLSRSLTNAIGEGTEAARRASDAGQRDKVFSIRRILSDYARIIRTIGLLVRDCIGNCRRLARNIDWIASITLVLAGEAISRVVSKGFLIQIPLSEMEARREAALNALKNLLGTNEAGYDDETWGNRTLGLTQIYQTIDLNNQTDLKVLLQEKELDRMLGELIDQIAKDNASGISSFTPAVNTTMEKIQRLNVLMDDIDIPWPPLVAFINELYLIRQIVDSRDNRVGMRLIDIARPPITYYGNRYGNLQTADFDARRRLSEIAISRSRLLDSIDRSIDHIETNDVLDALNRLISCIERAIDYYCLGTENDGMAEYRALFYSNVIEQFLNNGGSANQELDGFLAQILDQLRFPGYQPGHPAIELERQSYEESENRYLRMQNLIIQNGF